MGISTARQSLYISSTFQTQSHHVATMSVVSLLGVKILNNPAPFTAPYEFEITFECLEQLREDLEWKLTYVGSATSAEHDQELDSLLVGPIPIGVNKFIFEADPPNLSRLPSSEIIGVTVILLTCSYDGTAYGAEEAEMQAALEKEF